MPVIEEWLDAPEANRRRAASEGLRVWTARPYFKEHPGTAVALLAALRADPSEYVRKSAGNALRDVSRLHAELVGRELDTWDLTDRSVAFTHKLASRFVGPAGSTGKS
ncbi:DNA alkylation repair protein [Rugosimonospora africana]|uniref:DNA alkylation repair protein n=1 Tax=Rugosimonospora africana TaxID=556532 RepID=UPI003571492F